LQETLQEACSSIEVEFINSQGECEVMNVEDTAMPAEKKKDETGEISLNYKKESSGLGIEKKEEQKESQNLENKSAPASESLEHSHGASGQNEKNLWKVLKCPMPAYPRQARKNLQEGEVIIEIKVLPSGEIESSKIVLSSGFDSIDEAALNASKRIVLKYSGPKHAHSPVTLRVPYQFKLRK
jgi:TonB family protein